MSARALRWALPALAALVAVALFATSTRQRAAAAAGAGGVSTALPDFSGVWLPDAKASGRWPDERPFTPRMRELRARWDAAYAPVDLERDDEQTSCRPYTLPYLLTTITQYPFEIVMTPRRVYVFTETFGQVRRIDVDAPETARDPLPSYTGTSRARWEGGQLVVETTGIHPLHEGSRHPGSPSLHVVERWSFEDGDTGRLVNEVTIHDPVVYESPVTIRMVYKPAKDIAVGEYMCQQDLWDQHLDGSTSRIPWR